MLIAACRASDSGPLDPGKSSWPVFEQLGTRVLVLLYLVPFWFDLRPENRGIRDLMPPRMALTYSNTGKAAISPLGTASTGKPAFLHARRPPLITATRTPFSFSMFCSSRATRVLVA